MPKQNLSVNITGGEESLLRVQILLTMIRFYTAKHQSSIWSEKDTLWILRGCNLPIVVACLGLSMILYSFMN